MHGEHQQLDLRPPQCELAGGLQAGPARHRDIEHRQVDRLTQRDVDRHDAVARLGDDLEVRRPVQDHPQPAPYQRVIVGQQQPGAQGDAHRALTGTVSRTSVP